MVKIEVSHDRSYWVDRYVIAAELRAESHWLSAPSTKIFQLPSLPNQH